MIGHRRTPDVRQSRRKLLGPVARADVDHAGAASPLLHEGLDPGMALAGLALGGQLQFGAREAVNELERAAQAQLELDILAGAGVRRGRDGQARDLGEDLGQAAEHAVFGPEVVAPLADAVRLVDGGQGDRAIGQALQHPGLHQPFRRQVKQIQLALADPPPDQVLVAGVGAGIQPLGRDPQLLQGGDLVRHQGDQRRDHDPEAGAQQAGDLIAEALAAPRGQHRDGALAVQQGLDHMRLIAAERLMAEGPAQNLARAVQGWGRTQQVQTRIVRRSGAAVRRPRTRRRLCRDRVLNAARTFPLRHISDAFQRHDDFRHHFALNQLAAVIAEDG